MSSIAEKKCGVLGTSQEKVEDDKKHLTKLLLQNGFTDLPALYLLFIILVFHLREISNILSEDLNIYIKYQLWYL